jgi:hypothetical protein
MLLHHIKSCDLTQLRAGTLLNYCHGLEIAPCLDVADVQIEGEVLTKNR